MKLNLEEPFTINGINSWIHCLNIEFDNAEDREVQYHYHEYIELLYSLSGNAYVWLNGKCFNFGKGDLVVINSKEPHDITVVEQANYICIKFLPHILYSDEQSIFEFKYAMPFLIENSHQKIFHTGEIYGTDIHSLMCEIMTEWERRMAAYELIIRSNILRLFTGIFRYWHANNIFVSEKALSSSMKKALAYIAENYDTASERDVAEYCGCSYNYFSHIFKETMKKKFSDYITLVRLREAEKLLISTNNSITQIALDTGFSTASYFISRFKEYKGITPKKFRDQIKSLPREIMNSQA